MNTLFYTYDADGKMTKKEICDETGKIRAYYYTHGENGEVVTQFWVNDKYVTSHSKKDQFGRKVFDEMQLGSGFLSRQFTYHTGNVTEEHINSNKLKPSPTTQLVSQIVLSGGRTLSYEYDAEERITKVTDNMDGTVEYTYDALGQLLTETRDGVTTKFAYDHYGNLTAKGVCDETGTFVEESKILFTYGDANWKDLLTAYNGQSISYDGQGNPLSYLGHTLTWEKGRQLKSFDGISYTYNANGIRTSKTINGVLHTYILDGTKILRETWGENTLIPLYGNEESVCGIIYNNTAFYFQKNLQGDIVALTDQNGEAVAKYSYVAWGVCTITEDTSSLGIAAINPFCYRSYLHIVVIMLSIAMIKTAIVPVVAFQLQEKHIAVLLDLEFRY